MAKSYITLDTRIDSFKDEFNGLVNKVGDLNTLTTASDSDIVQAILIKILTKYVPAVPSFELVFCRGLAQYHQDISLP